MKSNLLVALIVLVLSAAVFAQDITEITELGRPIRDIQAAKDQWKYFKIDVGTTLQNMKDTDTLQVTVTPYSGDADLFVTSSGVPTTSLCENSNVCWRSTTPHGDVVSIQKNDERFPRGTPASLFIGVLGKTVTLFTINTWITGGRVLIEDGQPQTAFTAGGQYTYFDFTLDENANFSISVTPISATDPDIYASVDITQPRQGQTTWAKRSLGVDVLNINSNDPNYRSPATYHIGINAYNTDSYYTVAITKELSYMTLVEAVPLSHSVKREEYRYYKFYLVSQKDLVVTVTPQGAVRGDPDLYMVFDQADPKPSKSNYQWRSMSMAKKADTITVTGAQAGWYYIAVYGFFDTDFQIFASTDKNILLYDGIEQAGTIAPGGYSYFRYFHADEQADIGIVAYPLEAQDVQLYISKSSPRPTSEEGKYEFSGFHVGKQAVFSVAAAKGITGTYYIGVYSRAGANFTITAASNQSHIILTDGRVSSFNKVPEDSYRYFLYDIMDPAQDVIISVDPIIGDADLYADPTNIRPKRNSAAFSSVKGGEHTDTLVIPANDPLLQGSTRLYIGVHGFQESYFAITAYQPSSVLELMDGYSTAGYVEVGKYRYYKFFMPLDGDMTITMYVYGKEAHLYASTVNERPTAEDFQYSSTNFGSDTINAENVPKGWVYIAVAGIQGDAITFTISARVQRQFLMANREAYLAYTAAGNTTNYRTYVSSRCEYVVIAASLITGNTNLYVSSNGTATRTNYNWASTSWPGNVVIIPKTDPAFVGSTHWTIQVEATDNSDYYMSVVCSANQQNMYFYDGAVLNDGVARLGIAPAQGFVMYRFMLEAASDQVKEDYSIYIRSIKNTVAAYVHQDPTLAPNPRNYTFSSTSAGDRIMTLPKSSLKPRTLFIGMYGLNADAYFEITISKSSAPRYLMQEQPTAIAADQGTTNYFRVMNGRTSTAMFAYVESCDNNSPPTLYANPNVPYPDSSSPYKSLAVSKYMNQLSLTWSPSNSTKLRQVFLAATSHAPRQIYSIFASSEAEDSRPIVPKLPMYGAPINGLQAMLKFAKAKNPSKFEGRPLSYTVFKQIVAIENGEPVEMNFETSCGVKINGGKGYAVSPSLFNPVENAFEFVMDIEPRKIYRVNVIVTDDLGLAAAYEPVWVIDGRVYNAWPGVFLFHVSIGFVALMLMFAALTSYFAFGSVVNAIKGKRGIQIVPNVEFWKDLPFLVLDGIKFLVTCGRAVGTYSSFSDEAPNMDSVEAPVEEAPKEEPKPQQSSSGYGSIFCFGARTVRCGKGVM